MATKLSISVTSRGDQCYIGHGWPRSSKNYPPAIVAKAEPGTTIPDAPASSKGLEQVGRKEVGPSKSHIVALPRELREAVKGRLAGSDFAGAFRSQPEEYDYWIDSIEGEIPETLRGTLFRNGPGNFERGGQLYAHMLDGDGYICRFSFHDDGRVHFRSRYVQTRELGVEKAWGRILYRTTFGTQRWGGPLTNAFDLKLKNPANTNVLVWGERLFALWEAGAPYEMDPNTLETLGRGPATLNGLVTPGIAPSTTGSVVADRLLQLGKAVTAHPHMTPGPDPRLVLWSWQSKLKLPTGADMTFDVVEMDEEWNQVASTSFTMPDSNFNPHDFAVTSNYNVFFQNPTKFEMSMYLLGVKGPAQCVEFMDAHVPMSVWLLPRPNRSAPAKPLTFTAENSFLIHHANGFEEGDEVVVWSSGWDPEALAALKPGYGMLGSWAAVKTGDFSTVPFTSLLAHRINRVTGRVRRETMYREHNMDHPRVNPLWYSRPTRFVYFNMGCGEPGVCSPPQAFARLDTKTGECQVWAPGPRCFCEELLFVPGPAGETVEDDGHLLGMVYDNELQLSSLVVLDAKDFNKGPLARIWLKHHVPHGLHGQFTPSYFGPN